MTQKDGLPNDSESPKRVVKADPPEIPGKPWTPGEWLGDLELLGEVSVDLVVTVALSRKVFGFFGCIFFGCIFFLLIFEEVFGFGKVLVGVPRCLWL